MILDVPNGEAVAKELLRRNIIIDYRPDAGIRISPHFYNNEDDVDEAMTRCWTTSSPSERGTDDGASVTRSCAGDRQ